MCKYRYILHVNKRVILAFCTAAILLLASNGFAGNSMPFADSFESYSDQTELNNISNWFSSGIATGIVLNTSTSYHGSKLAYIGSASYLSNNIDGASAKVWTDFFLRPNLRATAPTVQSNAAVQFYFNTNGFAVVRDGFVNAWVTLTTTVGSVSATPVSTTSWNRVTVVTRYSDKSWSLIVNNQLVADNVGFVNSALTSYRTFSVSDNATIDSLVVQSGQPDSSLISSNTVLSGDADADGMPDAWEIQYFSYVSIQRAGDDYDSDGRSSASEYFRSTDPTDNSSYVLTLPFRQGYESATNQVLSGFKYGITNAGAVSVQGGIVLEGNRAIQLEDGLIDVPINDASGTNVWVQLYVKPIWQSSMPPPLNSSQVVGIFVSSNGSLYAFTSNVWTNANIVTTVPTNVWLGIVMHLDYVSTKWDLYVNTNGAFGQSMKMANSTSFWFNTSASKSNLGHLKVTNANGTAYVDVLAISKGYTNSGVGTLTNVLAADRMAGVVNSASMPPYSYSASDDILSGKIGSDLRIELSANDKLKIFLTNGWNIYKLDSSFAWQIDAAGSIPIASMHITEGMGMWLQRGTGDDAVAFYPYGASPYVSSNITIFGTNSAMFKGWNTLSSPFLTTRTANDPVNGFGFINAAVGDRIYIGNNKLNWNGTKWMDGGTESTQTLASGQAFWYYHRGTGMVWAVVP